MKILNYNELKNYKRAMSEIDKSIFNTVEAIVDDVRANGDDAVIKYTCYNSDEWIDFAQRVNKDKSVFSYSRKFDKVDDTNFRLVATPEEIKNAKIKVQSDMPELYQYFLKAAANIEEFHYAQKEESWASTSNKNLCGMIISPIEKAGLYVPGGQGFYPSSMLMNIIPAKVAGVRKLTVATPPQPDGTVNPLLLALADELGVDRIIKAGGAQVIAGLAYGTESIPKVYKITGPGNIYIAVAKRLVSGIVGIDSIAGPSEVVVFADKSANPEWVAVDLCAQAEHSDDTTSILISPDRDFIDKVNIEIEKLLPTLSRRDIIQKSFDSNSYTVHVNTLDEGFDIVQRIAPEHIEIMLDIDDETALNKTKNAGAIFIGEFTPVPVGDYYFGPNHVLPTNGTAVFSSPLGVYDFIRRTSFISVTEDYIRQNGEAIEAMANFEGFTAHGLSVRKRMSK